MTRAMTRTMVGVVIAAALASAAPASADSRAEAIVLFDQGIKDMKAGRLDKACAALQASLDLVKDSGTKGALATCHGRAGRIASAWLLWRELADTAPTAPLRANAASQAARLEPRLPRYTIRVVRPTPELVIDINGRRVASSVAVAVPIDPGKVAVTASQRDGDRAISETWTGDYTAVEGQTLVIDVPELVPRAARTSGPPSAASATIIAAPDSVAAPAPMVDLDARARRRTRGVTALVVGGVALGVAAGGTVLGLGARSKYADARKICGGAIDPCDPNQLATAQHSVDSARTSATISTVLFGVAGAAAAAGVIVWLTAPSIEHKAVAIAPSLASGAVGISLSGAF